MVKKTKENAMYKPLFDAEMYTTDDCYGPWEKNLVSNMEGIAQRTLSYWK